jgi:hypothetical protein
MEITPSLKPGLVEGVGVTSTNDEGEGDGDTDVVGWALHRRSEMSTTLLFGRKGSCRITPNNEITQETGERHEFVGT